MLLFSVNVSLLLVLLFSRQACTYKEEILEHRMPNILPTQSDTYLCHSFTVPHDETWYITSIGAILVDPNAIHHIIVITCPSLDTKSPIWSCGGEDDTAFPYAEACDEGAKHVEFMYDWTKGVDEYHYPKGVGFKVGGSGDYQNLILQVHYSDVSRFNESFRDTSGLKITFTRERTPMLAGLTSLQTDGDIQPGELAILEAPFVVQLPKDTTLRVFAYLVHTHDLGLLVTAYRVRDGNWTEIARRSPQMAKAFTPTDVSLQDGDTVFLRCVMCNLGVHMVSTGPTHHDEMCIVRLLHYAENGAFLPEFRFEPVEPTEPDATNPSYDEPVDRE